MLQLFKLLNMLNEPKKYSSDILVAYGVSFFVSPMIISVVNKFIKVPAFTLFNNSTVDFIVYLFIIWPALTFIPYLFLRRTPLQIQPTSLRCKGVVYPASSIKEFIAHSYPYKGIGSQPEEATIINMLEYSIDVIMLDGSQISIKTSLSGMSPEEVFKKLKETYPDKVFTIKERSENELKKQTSDFQYRFTIFSTMFLGFLFMGLSYYIMHSSHVYYKDFIDTPSQQLTKLFISTHPKETIFLLAGCILFLLVPGWIAIFKNSKNRTT